MATHDDWKLGTPPYLELPGDEEEYSRDDWEMDQADDEYHDVNRESEVRR